MLVEVNVVIDESNTYHETYSVPGGYIENILGKKKLKNKLKTLFTTFYENENENAISAQLYEVGITNERYIDFKCLIMMKSKYLKEEYKVLYKIDKLTLLLTMIKEVKDKLYAEIDEAIETYGR